MCRLHAGKGDPVGSSCGVSSYPVCNYAILSVITRNYIRTHRTRNYIRAEPHTPCCIRGRESVYYMVSDAEPFTSYLSAKQAPWDSSCGAFHVPRRLLYCTVAPGCTQLLKAQIHTACVRGPLPPTERFPDGCGQKDSIPYVPASPHPRVSIVNYVLQ